MENRLKWKKAHICEKIALRNWQAAQFDKIANTQIAFTRERRQLVCDVSRQQKIQILMTRSFGLQINLSSHPSIAVQVESLRKKLKPPPIKRLNSYIF